MQTMQVQVHTGTDIDGDPDKTYLERCLLPQPSLFYNQQLDAAYNIYHQFNANTPIGLLIAPMQSGKTTTFLLTSYMMLAYGRVKRVIIICGSNENELHQQLINDWQNTIHQFESRCHELMTTTTTTTSPFSSNFEIYKSSTLKKDTVKIHDHTLVIWDESHFAQDKKNRPYQMFENNGLTVSGNEDSMRRWNAKHSYLLTVSATPFSEKIDTYDTSVKHKFTVFMKPGDSYRGVEYYKNNGFIHEGKANNPHFFTNLLIEEAKRHDDNTDGTYGIVRVNNSTPASMIERCAKEANWAVIYYDGTCKESLGEQGLDSLQNPPPDNRHTLILLKNMCRMGKVVPKRYVSFVYEYVKETATDSCLQSLLGRMCGYSNFNPKGIHIYLSPSVLQVPSDKKVRTFIKNQQEAREKFLSSVSAAAAAAAEEIADFDRHQTFKLDKYKNQSELNRYIEFMNQRDIVPTKAKNVSASVSVHQRDAMSHNKYYLRPYKITSGMSSTLVESVHTYLNKTTGELVKRKNALGFTTEEKFDILSEVLRQIELDEAAFGDSVQREEVMKLLHTSLHTSLQEEVPAVAVAVAAASTVPTPMPSTLSKIAFHNVSNKIHGNKMLGNKLVICMERNAFFENNTHDKQIVVSFNTDPGHEDYFAITGYTYLANEETMQHFDKKGDIPVTSGEEAFHPSHTNMIDITDISDTAADTAAADATTSTLLQHLIRQLKSGKNVVRVPKKVGENLVRKIKEELIFHIEIAEIKHTKLKLVVPGRGRPPKYVEHCAFYFYIYVKQFTT